MRLSAKGIVVFSAAVAVAAFVYGQSRTNDPNIEPAAAAVATSGPYKGKVDPVKENGEIFVKWPKPNVALVFSGEQSGYIEPCGCAGLENQKGGLQRRFTMLRELRDKGWNLIEMDAGGLAKRSGVQAEMKLDFAYRALEKMGYTVVGFGPGDLQLDLLSIVINLDNPGESFVSANVGIGDFDSGFTKRYKIIEEGGMRIGVTSVLGKKEIAQFKNSSDYMFLDPEEAIAQVLPELQKAKCDQLVLIAHAERAEVEALAKRFPVFNWITSAHGPEVPPNEPVIIPGTNTRLIEVGYKGMYAVVVGLYKNGNPSFRYQRVPLDHRFIDAPEIHQMHIEYQQQLEQLGLSGLGIKPSPHPSGRKFAGSQACADCHTKATEVFLKTPHSHATETLVKLDPPRQFDPECLSCHVTGWEPQKYFPFDSGYVSLVETPQLAGNGCENCHGPAAQHVAAESGEIDASDEELEKLRAALRLKIVPNEGNKNEQVFKGGSVVDMCMQCHDHDNSPEFDFQTYWPKVKHEGVD